MTRTNRTSNLLSTPDVPSFSLDVLASFSLQLCNQIRWQYIFLGMFSKREGPRIQCLFSKLNI